MISIETFVFNPFMENTYLLHDDTGECIIVDAGCYEEAEKKEIREYIKDSGLNPVRLVNTHCHVDHVLGVRFLREKYQVPFCIHPLEKPILAATPMQGNFFGLEPGPAADPDEFFEDGAVITFGRSALQAIHVPGHSPGSLVLYAEGEGFLLAGDVLFRGSIGRSDLPGGDHETLVQHIREKLLVMDPGIVVYPGHGPETTLGEERDHNPYLS
jgi:glyoxylase-like metal-dependent hydrolase (beta-lactamase superfamily II)